mmetsp:Transcript_43204/g.101599  ORF Transcript_43204/g.101599 Transcript_43204/m.101599 type:complete len:579 (+) Transcript_43204:61-1797(+)
MGRLAAHVAAAVTNFSSWKLVALLYGCVQALALANDEYSISHDEILAKVRALEREVQRIPLLEAEVGRLRDAAAETARRTQDGSSGIEVAINHIWLMRCGAAVMLMQVGFAMLEAGTCRVKNVQNILLKNLTDVCIGTLTWWAVGWMMAFGGDNGGSSFAGNGQYFAHGFLSATEDGIYNPSDTNPQVRWVYQWAFCSASATIVSGGVAERMNFTAYVIFTVCMTGFIYPIVAHWTWSEAGWLAGGSNSSVTDLGYFDFAGSGVVHMSGGIGALIGAIVVGPRLGRFTAGCEEESFAPHSLPLIVFGTLILWYGWYGFNSGSTINIDVGDRSRLAAHVAMNTTIAPAAGGLTVLFIRLFLLRKYDLSGMCNGILAGLVSITAACANVHTYSCFAIAVLGGCIYQCSSMLLRILHIDDPLDAFSIHGACGAWGAIAAVIFDWGKGFDHFNGRAGFKCIQDGSGRCRDDAWISALGGQVAGLLCIAAWVTFWSILIFLPLRFLGILRASEEVEDRGLDKFRHSPATAYVIEHSRNSNNATNAPVKPPQILPTKFPPGPEQTLAPLPNGAPGGVRHPPSLH